MLQDLFPPDHVFRAKLAAQDAVMRELATRAATLLNAPPTDLARALAAREALGTTGIGSGIAIPHARLPTLAQPLALFARLDKPVDWQAIDGQPVDLVFLLLSPEQDAGLHLQALAAVTRRLRDRDIAHAIRTATDPATIRAALVD